MEITSVSIQLLRSEPLKIYPRVPRFRSSEPPVSAVLRLGTAEGYEGCCRMAVMPTADAGYARHTLRARASQILGLLKRELIGRDATDREWLAAQRYQYHWWGHVEWRALSAVDQAMWDLMGHYTGLPLHRLLGHCRDRVRAYASGPYLESVEDHARLASAAQAAGYTAFKIKPGGGALSRVKAIATAVRAAVGDGFDLMLDGQLQFSYADAYALGRHLSDLDYRWFEDPVPHHDLLAIDELCRRLPIAIAMCDHPDFGLHEIAQLIARRNGLRIVRSDVHKDGITGLRKVMALAEAYGMNCEVHGSGLPNLHAILSTANCEFFEDNLDDNFDAAGVALIPRAPDNPFRLGATGCVTAPAAPGIGWNLDRATIASRVIEEWD